MKYVYHARVELLDLSLGYCVKLNPGYAFQF